MKKITAHDLAEERKTIARKEDNRSDMPARLQDCQYRRGVVSVQDWGEPLVLLQYLHIAFVALRPHDDKIEFTSKNPHIPQPRGQVRLRKVIAWGGKSLHGAVNERVERRNILAFH